MTLSLRIPLYILSSLLIYKFPTSFVQFSDYLPDHISVGYVVWTLIDYELQDYWPQTLLTYTFSNHHLVSVL